MWTSSFLSNFERVQILQNKVVRVLGNYVRFENSTLRYFPKMKIPNVFKLRDCQLAILLINV